MSERLGPDTTTSILWRRLDRPGHEFAHLELREGSWRLEGTAVFAHEEDQACRLDYAIRCDARWRTRATQVSGWIGERRVAIEVTVDEAHTWRLNGRECPAVAGAIDIDLNFSPSTNLLPIRRLDLAVGQAAEVRAAWLRFPNLTLEPLAQSYRRTAAGTYRYESAGGRFVADLDVDAAGFVTRYAEIWQRETGLRPA
jgi:hypothetical protein